LDDVKPLKVEEWLKDLPLRKKSKQHIRDLMRQVFTWAMKWELLDMDVNPMKLVSIKARPDEEPSTKRILTAEEFQQLLPLIPVPFRTMVLVAACLGLRVSEILGLQWGDIHWERLEIRIQRAVVLATVGKVKTPKSKSIMPLDPDLAALLLEYQRSTAPNALPEQWLFENPARGKPWRPSHIQQKWIRPAGLKVTGEDAVGTTFDIRSQVCFASSERMSRFNKNCCGTRTSIPLCKSTPKPPAPKSGKLSARLCGWFYRGGLNGRFWTCEKLTN